jgi:energy-coupling factor transport system ATP-binding protein
MTTAIHWDSATVRFGDSPNLTAPTVNAELSRGELCVVAGPTGSGKSTLLATVNGAVPHTNGATLAGRVQTLGRDTAAHPPRRLADVVSVVPARPVDAFIASTVEDEIGYSLDRLHLGATTRSRRIDDLLGRLGIAELRTRPLATLSAGQQQRVALAAALAAEPDVLVLDEPTSGLDATGAESFARALQTLTRAAGTTVLLSEHRLERVLEFATSALYLPGDGPAWYGEPRDVLGRAPSTAPVLELSRLLRWDPPALTVTEALAAALTHPLPEPDASLVLPDPPEAVVPRDAVVARVDKLTYRHGPLAAVRDLDLTIRAGEIVALRGDNGAGKSTLLSCLAGVLVPQQGVITVAGQNPARLGRRDRVGAVGLVPADPGELLLTDRVDRECSAADDEADVPAGRTAFVLDALLPGLSPIGNPRSMSGGERQALALAVVLARGPALILLDEPTHGLDYATKARLTTMLRQLAAAGHAVLIATHDTELIAPLASRVMTLAEGRVTADTSTGDALRAQVLRTQVGQIMAPAPLYTVDDVRRELAG